MRPSAWRSASIAGSRWRSGTSSSWSHRSGRSHRVSTPSTDAPCLISNTGTIGGFVPTGDPANPYHSVALPTRLAVKRYSAFGGYRGRFYALADDGEIWPMPTW